MDPKRLELYDKIKDRGLTPEQDQKILLELRDDGTHDFSAHVGGAGEATFSHIFETVYEHSDLLHLQAFKAIKSTINITRRSMDELLERDKQREKDGFPRKINVGKMIKPGKSGKDKVVVVPTTVEEKFIHDPSFKESGEGSSTGGTGEGEVGDIIGEQPVREPGAAGSDSGEGEGGVHELESSAYDLGKILTEKFELPNLKDKGKKRSLSRYTYDMTDKHRRFGQFLDKKATLREILETNIHLGNVPDTSHIDPSRFLISPTDMVYRILSREKDYESQAIVFFLRDYSGSMAGKATELVVAQHVLIYSWLLYQYAMQVETRFILHDTEASEVPDFYTYYNSKVAGGTQVASAYRLVNTIVKKENLIQDYNIYVFHGTDGDDWDTDGKAAIPELKKMLVYTNRVGITIAEHLRRDSSSSEVEKYLKNSKLLTEKPKLIRLDVMQEDVDEPRLIEGIKKLISD
jgi:uncharacterized sporulation protein YeaH/YhbH (DUF444 family)